MDMYKLSSLFVPTLPPLAILGYIMDIYKLTSLFVPYTLLPPPLAVLGFIMDVYKNM